MDVTLVLLIVGAFIVGVAVTWLFMGRNTNNYHKGTKQFPVELTEQRTIEQQPTDQLCGKNTPIAADEIKQKYEKLLAEANSQSAKLNEQIKALSSGKGDNLSKQLAEESDKLRKEAEALKKKIKDLEDEIDDNEDDISDLKKKISKKDSIIATTQDELTKEHKRSKQLDEDLSAVREQLKEKESELNLKIGSLKFIQEILSAKESSSEDTRTLFRNIDYFESFVKNNFIDLNAYLFNKYVLRFQEYGGDRGLDNQRKYYSDGFDQWASTKRKSWLDKKTTIAFVGEFSAGKTSIVNRILSQDRKDIPLLPVSTKATTAIPTYIAGGPKVTYSFISGDGKQKTILENTFKMVSKEILEQVKGVSALIKYFVMTYKNPNLDGLSILDTPGFNSNDKEDRDRTIDVINECDALFWVFDVNAGTINRSSISVIKEKLNKPLFVVINKIDTKSPSEVQKVENLIRKTLSEEGLNIQGVIRFSSKTPLADIMNPIKSVNKITTRDKFVEELKNDFEQLIKVLNSEIKKKNKEYEKALNKARDIEDNFVNAMKLMKDNCEEAESIPHFETHFWTADVYEMNFSEYNQLKELLQTIAKDNVKSLNNGFNNRVEIQGTIKKAWEDLKDIQISLQKVEDCYEQYKKLTTNL
ncbi:MAG: dynamin family protein [Bacteroidaceae bacterium]|nr:dynamin family protein [Bacteroidaceae bacterium]